MVSQTSEPPQSTEHKDEAWARESVANWRHANRGGIRRLIASTVRLADIQLKIWLTQAKMTVARIVLYVLLYAVAGVMAILGTIFLFIGLFKILTDVIGIPAVWSFLIFALFTFGVAGTVVLIAQKALSKKAGEPDKTSQKQPDKPR
ncbi:MAG: phage holin family protein [Phycisphaerae bacterium]